MGEDGGSQTGWWLGGEEAQNEPNPCVEECGEGEHGIDTWAEALAPLPPVHSDVRSLENIVMASGKLGGVAGGCVEAHLHKQKKDQKTERRGGENKREKKHRRNRDIKRERRERRERQGEREREREREREIERER